MSNNRLKDFQHACFMKVLYQITRSTIAEIPIGRVTLYFCEVFFSLSVFPSFLLSFEWGHGLGTWQEKEISHEKSHRVNAYWRLNSKRVYPLFLQKLAEISGCKVDQIIGNTFMCKFSIHVLNLIWMYASILVVFFSWASLVIRKTRLDFYRTNLRINTKVQSITISQKKINKKKID